MTLSATTRKWVLWISAITLVIIIGIWAGYFARGALYDLAIENKNAGRTQEAERYLLAAAHLGDISSMYTLANIYVRGIHGRIQPDEAERWLMQCAKSGDANCQELLGLLFWAGYGRPPNYIDAEQWLAKAAQNGKIDAANWLISVRRKEPATFALRREQSS